MNQAEFLSNSQDATSFRVQFCSFLQQSIPFAEQHYLIWILPKKLWFVAHEFNCYTVFLDVMLIQILLQNMWLHWWRRTSLLMSWENLVSEIFMSFFRTVSGLALISFLQFSFLWLQCKLSSAFCGLFCQIKQRYGFSLIRGVGQKSPSRTHRIHRVVLISVVICYVI